MKVTGFLVFGYRILGLRVLGTGFRFWVLCIFWVFGCLGLGFLGGFVAKRVSDLRELGFVGFWFKGLWF